MSVDWTLQTAIFLSLAMTFPLWSTLMVSLPLQTVWVMALFVVVSVQVLVIIKTVLQFLLNC